VSYRNTNRRGLPALLEALGEARGRYGEGCAERKLELLTELKPVRHERASTLREWHAHLLFLRAFPDDAVVESRACALLEHTATQVRGLPRKERLRLEDSGLAGTTSRHTFEAPIAAWLVKRFGADVVIDWSRLADPNSVQELLSLVALRAEQDGLDGDTLSTRRWLERAAGGGREGVLAWLLKRLTRTRATPALRDALYDRAEIPLAWALGNGQASATPAAGVNVGPTHYRRGLRRLPERPELLISTPLPGIRRLNERQALEVIDLTRATLAARCREVYAVSHANPAEVYRADLGEGISLALMGLLPACRLSLESNYAYLLLSNGVPIGYAGATPLYRQANTGINVFEPFRGSEAAFIAVQVLRVLRTVFGVARFILNPYQIGAGNREAIESGAFWFYYRLGFRPVVPALAELAARERARREARPGHRTDSPTLVRLAQSDMELVLPGARTHHRFDEAWLERLSLLATDRLNLAGGEAALARTVKRALAIRSTARWSPAEREVLAALSPLLSLVDPARLGPDAKAALVRLVRAKGADQEAGYVRAAARDPTFLPGLMRIARRQSWSLVPRDACPAGPAEGAAEIRRGRSGDASRTGRGRLF
jgi:hypothetical protein